jgi:hypothetical protein
MAAFAVPRDPRIKDQGVGRSRGADGSAGVIPAARAVRRSPRGQTRLWITKVATYLADACALKRRPLLDRH